MPLPPIEDRPWLTVQEAAAILGLKATGGYNAVHREFIPIVFDEFGKRKFYVPKARFMAKLNGLSEDELKEVLDGEKNETPQRFEH